MDNLKNEEKQHAGKRTGSVLLNDRKRGLIFICLIVSGIASSTLSTAMTTALPNLVEYFGVSTSIGQWVTSGYSLAMGMVLPLTAFLITRFPTKKLYLSGIACFILGLLLSIFTTNFGGTKNPGGIFFLSEQQKSSSAVGRAFYADGRTRTGTDYLRLILSQVRLPIPPHRLIFCSACEKQREYFKQKHRKISRSCN